MVSFVIRFGILLAIVFGIAYALTRALRQNAHGKAAQRIQADITDLKNGLEAGLYTNAEYQDLATRIRVACEEQSIEVPELPEFIEPRQRRDP